MTGYGAFWERRPSGFSGTPVRLVLRVGEPPKTSTKENLQNLLKFGSQFDNIEIK